MEKKIEMKGVFIGEAIEKETPILSNAEYEKNKAAFEAEVSSYKTKTALGLFM